MNERDIRSFEELEFYFLQDLSYLKDKIVVNDLPSSCYSILAIIDNKVVVTTDRDNYIVYNDVSIDNLKEGDLIMVTPSNFVKIESDKVLKEIESRTRDTSISIYEFRDNLKKDVKEITKDNINLLFESYVRQKEVEEQEREKQRIQYKKEQEKQRVEAEKRDKVLQKYLSTGEYVKGDITIRGNTLTILNEDFILELDTGSIKDYFGYSYIENNLRDSYDFKHTELRLIIDSLIQKKVAFKITYNFKESHFTFNKERLLFNDIPIQKQSAVKVFYWVTGSKEEIPTEKIKAYSRLSGVKFKVLNNITHIELGSSLKLPISINYIDDNLMEVEFLGKKKVFDWKELKKYLVCGNNIISYFYSTDNFLDFVKEIGIEKKEMYQQIRLIMALQEI